MCVCGTTCSRVVRRYLPQSAQWSHRFSLPIDPLCNTICDRRRASRKLARFSFKCIRCGCNPCIQTLKLDQARAALLEFSSAETKATVVWSRMSCNVDEYGPEAILDISCEDRQLVTINCKGVSYRMSFDSFLQNTVAAIQDDTLANLSWLLLMLIRRFCPTKSYVLFGSGRKRISLSPCT